MLAQLSNRLGDYLTTLEPCTRHGNERARVAMFDATDVSIVIDQLAGDEGLAERA